MSRSHDLPDAGRAALIIGHPGHELRVHHWMERCRPLVFVLTDGSGHSGRDRLESTREVLAATGARVGAVFGPWTDREAYRVILDRRLDAVQQVIMDVAAELVSAEIEVVASDAVEGFNPTHDLCSVVAESAVQIASRRRSRPVEHLDFLLEAAPDAGLRAAGSPDVLRLELDSEALRRKMDRAGAYEELRDEVERALGALPPGAFQVEVLRPVAPDRDLTAQALPTGGTVPTYESYGEERVAQGLYGQVLRLTEHWLPLAQSIRAWAASV